MPERPLLILPHPGEPVTRRKRTGGGGKFHRPSPERQAERLGPRFALLQEALEARRARLQAEAHDLVPEEVIVLETVGTVDDFIRAVEHVPGMEWLAEVEEEEVPPDDDFFAMSKGGERRPDKALRGRIFMVFTNKSALEQMLSLWHDWQSNSPLPRGLGKWKTLFRQLRDVRHWGVQDRLLETGVLDDWRERVEYGQEIVPCEIELWYRRNPEQRRIARNRTAALVEELDGQVVNEAHIEDIAYHALLAHLPVDRIRPLFDSLDNEVNLVQCEQIQFLRATGQMVSVLPGDDRDRDSQVPPEAESVGWPVVALLDGLPLQAHRRLQGRLIVDDPDGFELDYPAATRRHGTAMASLILHGDLAAGDPPLPRPLYVRPILQQDARDWRNNTETAPERMLVVDLIHRAVRRLFDGEGDIPPVAPQVTIVNLSIGIADRPFERFLSPLARLLDWLAWRYGVLFVVSAGNCPHTIVLPPGEPDDQEQVIRSIAADARHRRLLSPAESVNALTVAALHEDASTDPPAPGWRDPYTTAGLPSPINAQGMGYRRGIKPDLLAVGGRVVMQRAWNAGDRQNELRIYAGSGAPGQLVASPGTAPGEQDATWHSRGTSNATAMVSRACGWLYDLMEELRDEPTGEVIDTIPRAVWLKALVAHGTEWGAAGAALTNILKNEADNRQFREYITRLLGYGAMNIDRVCECTARRVTALSAGALREDESHIHRLPLPPSLNGLRGYRRLTITLAWLSPVNPRHQGWRRADLWFSPPQAPLQVERRQADGRAAQRGTLQHEILEGKKAGVFVDGESLDIQVSCRASAGALDDEVPYALATTLEIAEELYIDLYDEVRSRIHATRVRAEAGV